MKRFKNHLIAAAVLSVLAVIGTIMNFHQATAQTGPPNGLAVNIVNPLPVPVTGSTTISGTVAATQSGMWNVGIVGTPTVNINNTGNPLHVLISPPVNAFTIAPQEISQIAQGDLHLTPDPSGTRYAISSFTVSNPTGVTSEIQMSAYAVGVSLLNCGIAANVVAQAQGPKLTVAAQSTATLTFPQPFMTAPVSGLGVCLAANDLNAPPGMSWSAVGYKVLP